MSTTPHYGTENAGFPVVLGGFTAEVIWTANHALALTDEARSLWQYGRVSQAMSITDSVVVAQDKTANVEHTLSLVQSALRVISVNGSDTMTVDSVVDFEFILEDRKVAGDTLNLTQTVLSLSAVPVEDVLGLTDESIGRGPFYLAINQWMPINQRLATPFFLDIEDDLGLVQLLPTPLYGTGNTTLNMSDVASITNIVDTLALVQSASGSKLYEVEHEMTITQNVILISNWVRRIDEDLGVGHAMTYFIDDPCNLKNYTPFQGENTVNTTFASPSATIPPTFKDASVDRLTLYYPSAAAIARQLIIRAPQFGNRDQNSYTRVSRETRGGELSVYADPDWPNLRTLSCTVTGLTSNEAEEYLTFLYATLGKTIELCDWEGRLWTGVMTNPEEPITQDGKCKYTISFQLEGRMYNTALPETETDGFALNLTDTATAVIV